MEKSKPELVAEKLISSSKCIGRDVSTQFQDWLEWLIDIFSIEKILQYNGDYNMIIDFAKCSNPLFAECLTLWVECAHEYQKQHKCIDFFGEIYELCFQSKGKSSRMQQFFNPYFLSNLIAKSLIVRTAKNGVIYVSEPSCGSGRNLLALWETADWKKCLIFYAEDLDPVSVLMCTLNMMINGMIGYVVCHNTLLPDDFIFGFAVNEVRSPIPSDHFSVRPITSEQYKAISPLRNDGEK